MSKPEWTPGPWRATTKRLVQSGLGSIVRGSFRIEQAEAFVGKTYGGLGEQEKANADLMAAAPELYEALYQTQQILGNSPHRDAYGIIEARLEKNAAALAKARGESQ